MSGPREIYQGGKDRHLREVSRKTGIPLSEMIFFDNEPGNCQTVAAAGVTSAYTPNGLDREIFCRALETYPAPGKVVK